MKQIRKSVFETNSSSTHSLVLCEEDSSKVRQVLAGYRLNENSLDEESFSECYDGGKFIIKMGEFGWDHFRLFTFEAKVSYVFTYFYCLNGCLSRDIMERLEDAIKMHYGESTEIYYQGNTELYERDELSEELEANIYEGYVDHQSVDEETTAYLKSNLYEFLTNEDYEVRGGNDNEDDWGYDD